MIKKSVFFSIFFLNLICNNVLCQKKLDYNDLDDAVVLIKRYDENGFYLGHGSGFFIDSKGSIATNYHVINNAYKIKIVSEIKNFREEHEMERIISGDEYLDMAVIQIENKKNIEFPYLKQSTNLPKKGDNVSAIGTPADTIYMNTVTKGGVSNIHENVFIQTNVDITHGSSGGPLLNEEGEVVGITSFGDPTDDGARANINFARSILLLKELPVLNVKRIMDQEKVEAQRLCFSIFTRDKKVYNNYKFLWNKKSQYFDKLFDFAETPQCGDKGTIVLDLLPGDYSCNLVHKFSGEIINVGVFKVSSDGTNVFEVKLPDDQQTKYTPEKKEEKPKVKIAETKIGKAINKAINKVSTFDGYDNTIGLSLSSNRYTTSFGDNLILPFCFFLESRTQSAKRSLRFNYMFFYNKIATTTPAVKNYYHSFIFDYKFVVHEKNQFNFYIAPCLGLNDIVRYLDYPTYSTRRSENSFLIGPRFGIDGIVKNSNFIISCDFAPLVVTRSSYFSSMVDFNLMIGYRFKKD